MIRPFLGTVGFISVALFTQVTEATTHQSQIVVMDGTKFSPEQIRIRSGDTIKWVNKDLVSHTATADDNSFDSKTVNQGKSWKHKFKKIGDINYHCVFHPTMKGQIHVE